MGDAVLAGKHAIVTGAARGIGLAIAQAVADAGAAVTLFDLNVPALDEAVAGLCAQGFSARGAVVNLAEPGAIREAVDKAAATGGLHLLVNNAGICPMTSFDAIAPEEWDLVLDINLRGAFFCAQAAIPHLRAAGGGKIVNIASSAGQMGGIAVGVHYASAKAGLLGMTKSLARILAPSIQVNAVAPGTTESEMTRAWSAATLAGIERRIPAGRLGRPGDVAAAVLFLLSPAADYLTGQTLSVNGGLLMP